MSSFQIINISNNNSGPMENTVLQLTSFRHKFHISMQTNKQTNKKKFTNVESQATTIVINTFSLEGSFSLASLPSPFSMLGLPVH